MTVSTTSNPTVQAVGAEVQSRSSELRKELGLFDLVLAQLLIIIVPDYIGTAVKAGPSHDQAAAGTANFDEWTHHWNVLITAHGLIMVFFTVMAAMMGGFGNWFVPLMDPRPTWHSRRMNNISFWLLVPLLLLGSTFVSGGQVGAGTGWTLYAPLSTSGLSWLAVHMVIFSLHRGRELDPGAINFITTIFNAPA